MSCPSTTLTNIAQLNYCNPFLKDNVMVKMCIIIMIISRYIPLYL